MDIKEFDMCWCLGQKLLFFFFFGGGGGEGAGCMYEQCLAQCSDFLLEVPPSGNAFYILFSSGVPGKQAIC